MRKEKKRCEDQGEGRCDFGEAERLLSESRHTSARVPSACVDNGAERGRHAMQRKGTVTTGYRAGQVRESDSEGYCSASCCFGGGRWSSLTSLRAA